MELKHFTFRLKLEHTFSISRESYDYQDTLIVALTEDGQTGYGEATANPYYGVTIATMQQEIERQKKEILEFKWEKPQELHGHLQSLGMQPFTLCAIDLAAHDLYGKMQGKPLYELWGTSAENYPLTSYTIGLDSIENMIAKLKEKPWPIYKIKLGTEEDVAIVSALREHTDAIFRIDANCAWEVQETIENAEQLSQLGVEFLEQPLAADNWSGMEVVQHHSVLPVIADESCITEGDVDRCALHFSGINIKLTKCGGLTPALRMIKRARNLGLKVMVGCMTESTVGISAIAQLLPQLDYVDMDGAMLLAGDIADGVVIGNDARVLFPTTGGSGISLR